MEPEKKKQHSSTLQEKIVAIRKVENGSRLSSVASECGVSVETVRRWKINKEIIKKEYEDAIARGENFVRYKRRKVQNAALEDGLYEWFKRERDRGMTVSGPMVIAKALLLNEKTGGDPEFSASQGWLHKWKKRHGIREIGVQGERLSLDLEAVERGKQELQLEKLEEIKLESLANLEESDNEEHDDIPQQDNSYIPFPVSDPLSNSEPETTQTKSSIEFVSCAKQFSEDSPSKRRKIIDESPRAPESVRSPDSSSQIREEDEFDVFGKYVALQLQRLPLENALELEAQIHQLIMDTRLQIIRSTKEAANSISKLPTTSSST